MRDKRRTHLHPSWEKVARRVAPRRMTGVPAGYSVQHHPSSDLAVASLRLGHLLPVNGEKE